MVIVGSPWARDTMPLHCDDADADADADDGGTARDASPCVERGRTRCRLIETPQSDEDARVDVELAGCPAMAKNWDWTRTRRAAAAVAAVAV